MNEKDLRNSKNDIPELNDNLKDKIKIRYNAKPKKHFEFKVWHGVSLASALGLATCVVLAISLAPTKAASDLEADKSSSLAISERSSAEVISLRTSEEGEYFGASECEETDFGTSGEIEAYSGEIISKKTAEDAADLATKEKEGQQENVVKAGQLTASAYNDNENFDFFYQLVSSGQEENGAFYEYYTQYAFKTKNRVKVSIPTNVDANISLLDSEENIIFATTNDKQGNAYLYSENIIDETNKVVISYYNNEGNITTLEVAASNNIDLTGTIIDGASKAKEVIDLMLILDTTGSMGDEIKYLKAELANVIERVSTSNDATINLAILAYRDNDDEYVTIFHDFSSNIEEQINYLKELDAEGGGDFEEAVEVAFKEASAASWHEDATKIILFVADAPCHDEDIASLNKTTLALAKNGIKMITVASSGIDTKTEYLFRCQSMMLGGTYTFLTDDSGIGSSHLEAKTKEKCEVEYVNSMLIRLINGYYTGVFTKPINYQQDTQN